MATPCRLVACIASLLLQLAACSESASGEAVVGGGLLRGTAANGPPGAAAEAGMQSDEPLNPSVDEWQSFMEDGYTERSDGAAAAGTSSDLGLAMMTIGMGNSSSNSTAGLDAATMLSAARSQSASSLAGKIYQHANWEGYYMGVYGDIVSLGGEWNDKLSSLTIYPMWCLTLYEHVSFAGKWRRMCAGSSTWKISYVGASWNDLVSSIRVAPRR